MDFCIGWLMTLFISLTNHLMEVCVNSYSTRWAMMKI